MIKPCNTVRTEVGRCRYGYRSILLRPSSVVRATYHSPAAARSSSTFYNIKAAEKSARARADRPSGWADSAAAPLGEVVGLGAEVLVLMAPDELGVDEPEPND